MRPPLHCSSPAMPHKCLTSISCQPGYILLDPRWEAGRRVRALEIEWRIYERMAVADLKRLHSKALSMCTAKMATDGSRATPCRVGETPIADTLQGMRRATVRWWISTDFHLTSLAGLHHHQNLPFAHPGAYTRHSHTHSAQARRLQIQPLRRGPHPQRAPGHG